MNQKEDKPMKSIVTVAVVCGAMFMSSILQAQTSLTPAQQKKVSDELKRFGADLNLSPTQKDQMRSILGDQISQTSAVRKDSSLSQSEKAAKIAEIRNAQHVKIAGVLSPDQLQKWDVEAAKARHAAKRAATK